MAKKSSRPQKNTSSRANGKPKMQTRPSNQAASQRAKERKRTARAVNSSVPGKSSTPRVVKKRHFVRVKTFFKEKKARFHTERAKHFRPHKSFKRSYAEDYRRSFETPGLLQHAVLAFQMFFKYWRTFLPFLGLMVILYMVAVGLLGEEVYDQAKSTLDEGTENLAAGKIGNFAKAGILLISMVTTGGLDNGMDDTEFVFMLMLFLIMWLVVIFLLRHFMAGERPRLRDGLYNAMGPLFATLTVFIVIAIQIIPIMIVVIAYSAAVLTDFLSTPFYALLFFTFSAIMILLSVYLLCSSIIALVAVTSPGMYPGKAISAASDVISGRRTKLVIRVIYMFFVIALVYVIIMLPVILIDMWLKSTWSFFNGWPIVPFFLLASTCFVFMFATTYIYIYYRWLIDYKEK